MTLQMRFITYTSPATRRGPSFVSAPGSARHTPLKSAAQKPDGWLTKTFWPHSEPTRAPPISRAMQISAPEHAFRYKITYVDGRNEVVPMEIDEYEREVSRVDSMEID